MSVTIAPNGQWIFRGATKDVVMNPGTIVEWTSQANGVTKDKSGELIAIIMPNQSLTKFIPKDVSQRAIRANELSNNVRGLVKVLRGGRSELHDYYAPPMSWLKPGDVSG